MIVALPLAIAPGEEGVTLEGTTALPLAVRPLRVLLAEDEDISNFAMGVMLKRLGHRVVSVSNGQEALHELESAHFDVVLMDIQMPVLDGVEATRRIRAMTGSRARVHIVALTAYAMEGDREKFLSADMDDYVTKPVSQEDLMRALERAALLLDKNSPVQ